MTITFNALKQVFTDTMKRKLKEIIFNLKEFRDINKIDANGNTTLHRAILENNIEQVKLIIQSQSVIKHNLALFYKNNQNLTPVDLVLQEANTEPCKFSIELKKIVINAQDVHGNTALHKAILESDIAKAQSLIQHGADIFLKNDDEMSALQLLFDQQEQGIDRNFDQLLNLLVNTQDLYGNSVLHYIASNPDLLIHENDIKNLNDVKSINFFIKNQTAKYRAVKQKLCVAHANNLNKQNEQGYAPLHYAVITKNYALVHTLLNHNADINIQDNQGYAPLHYAIKIKNITLINILLARGANPNLVDLLGYSPLYYIKTTPELFYNQYLIFYHYKNNGIDISSNRLVNSETENSDTKPNQSEVLSTLDCPEQSTQGSDSNLTGETAG